MLLQARIIWQVFGFCTFRFLEGGTAMSIHEEKVHADLEIFDDDLPALATKALDRGGTLAPAKTTSVSLAAEPVVEAISNETENDLISDTAANDVSVHLGSAATHGTHLKWGPELGSGPINRLAVALAA